MALSKARLLVVSADVRRRHTHNDQHYKLSDAFIERAIPGKALSRFSYYGLALYWPVEGQYARYSLWEIEIAKRGTDGSRERLTWRFLAMHRRWLNNIFRSIVLVDRRHVEALKKYCASNKVSIEHYDFSGELTI
jgi:hypothetical protein